MKKKRKPTYLSFKIGKDRYAVSTHKVLEVLENQRITQIPNSHSFIEGVISFRGSIIPIINIHNKISDAKATHSESYVIIVFDTTINNKKAQIAAYANNVQDVIALNDNEILPVPDEGLTFNAEYLKGMIAHKKDFIFIFDIDKVLSISNL